MRGCKLGPATCSGGGCLLHSLICPASASFRPFPAAVRSKLLPVLLEWDLQQQQQGESPFRGQLQGVEFKAVEVQKIHGLRSNKDELTGAVAGLLWILSFAKRYAGCALSLE